MLTLKRFEAMVQSYGADLTRWPVNLRGEAKQLLDASSEARVMLDEARELDDALEAATAREHAANWPQGEEAAALARLRSRVTDRIGNSSDQGVAHLRSRWRPGDISRWLLDLRLFPAGVTLGKLALIAGAAAIVGLVIGATSFVAPPPGDPLLTVLLPEPIHLSED